MYSGTTLRTKSGRILGVHQRIDRLARQGLKKLPIADNNFPAIKSILHFEGLNGPDGIKRKSPARDEPWHFINPNDPNDRRLLNIISNHAINLQKALSVCATEKASFEAAWMAHAITDGLTPAHHYPLEDKLQELRGEPLNTRDSLIDKGFISGENLKEIFKNNWRYWGAKGMMSTHILFEIGIATAISTHKYKTITPPESEIEYVKKHGIKQIFLKYLYKIDSLKMYEEFQYSGWNRKLARQTKDFLIPEIVKCVELGWISSIEGCR